MEERKTQCDSDWCDGMKEERLEGKEGKKDKPRQDNNRGININIYNY